MATYVSPLDIALRVYHMPGASLITGMYPSVELVGEPKSFGKLIIELHGYQRKFAIYIDDVEAILDVVEYVITSNHFHEIMIEHWRNTEC